MEDAIRFRHNVMNVDSIAAFERIKGGINQNCKDVYFVRLTGVNDSLVSDIEQMDWRMLRRMADGSVIYRRVLSLPNPAAAKETAEYERYYQEWMSRQKEAAVTGILKNSPAYARILGNGMKKALDLYFSDRPYNESIAKNFAVKLMFWHDWLLGGALAGWDGRMSVKLVLSNIIKRQEYLFAFLLTLLGCDVLLIQSEADISEKEERLCLSRKTKLGSFAKVRLPEETGKLVQVQKPGKERESRPVQAKKPGKEQPKKPVQTRKPERTPSPAVSALSEETRREKSFEQLAQLASSVVLIGIHDKRGNMIGTGSGIMIGRDGYILTNSHVASGGNSYSIRIEEDERIYSTDELIKYHAVLDLAILRIDRTLAPLTVYRGKKPLVRGQKVVAIGSPLGLFNSVSDGIISGFRKIDGVDMIQFTAPTSHGSSGGALLNMYGEVIGISTAGFDHAQNINLAVGYESIGSFIKGFT